MKTDITVLLDRSGSMSSIREDTIGGFNAFLEDQKELPGEAVISLVQFDGQGYDRVIDAVSLADAKPLTLETFVPRGETPLLDSMARVITETGVRLSALPDSSRPDNVLMVIITDGHENASIDTTRDQVLRAVTHQTEVYKWTFIYLGANQDAIAEARSFGIALDHAATYQATPNSARAAYSGLRAMGASARAGKRPAFTSAQRAAMSKR